MKPLSNDIVLRPRFQFDVPNSQEKALVAFEKALENPFLVKRIDEHVFIKFNAENNHLWSPQLHLEIDPIDEKNCRVHGVFGPNPTLWTFFMFLHFGVGMLFIVLSIWAYTSARLHKPYTLQLVLMGFMIVLWFVLYFFGRTGKHKGKPQMRELYQFMASVLA